MNRLNTAEQARVVCSTVARHTHTQPEPGTDPGTDRHTHTRPKSQSQGQHHTTTTPHSSPLSIISPRASQSIPEHPRASQSLFHINSDVNTMTSYNPETLGSIRKSWGILEDLLTRHTLPVFRKKKIKLIGKKKPSRPMIRW